MSEPIDWTPEELLAELRHRERVRRGGPKAAPTTPTIGATAAGAGPVTPRDTTGVVPRFRRIGELSTAELATLLRTQQRAVYGTDDRKDVRDVTDKRAKTLADSSLALVEAADLTAAADGNWTLKTSSYQADYNLCSSEPFAAQPLGCFCSGVLVAPDVVATAGHCVKNTKDLAHIRFVFGFRMHDASTARTTFPADDVYEGKDVIGRALATDGTDWALVRLTRAVKGRKPVPMRKTGKIAGDEPLFVIGHPCGLPQKVAGGAQVRKNSDKPFFVANLDTYGGNSGSPVFSAKSYQLEGLLVRGQTDFVSKGDCNVSQVFPTSGAGGEDVTRSTVWAGSIPSQPAKSAGGRAGAKARTPRRPARAAAKRKRR